MELNKYLKADSCTYKYKALIGVGGIGTGTFFQLNGNHTIGREESRSGYFLDRKDYCKLHIIYHYVQNILGPDFEVFPIGKIGDDDPGMRLWQEMEQTGFNMAYIEQSANYQTLFSYCFIYPDGSGGNLTTNDSACSKVDPQFVSLAESTFKAYAGKGIALAVPEVPLEARKQLLHLAAKHHLFKAASFTSEEISRVLQSDILNFTDLLAINLDEAAAAAEMNVEEAFHQEIIETAVTKMSQINPNIQICITHGKHGSWTWNGDSLHHIPSVKVNVKNTAGAGDAHLAGLITGLTCGLTLREAQQLAVLIAGMSVTSPHTINKDINRNTLLALAEQTKYSLNKNVYDMLLQHDKQPS